MGEKTNISYKSKISSNCVIGKDTQIMDDCVIKNSIIGQNCKIFNNTIIINSIILDKVEIR